MRVTMPACLHSLMLGACLAAWTPPASAQSETETAAPPAAANSQETSAKLAKVERPAVDLAAQRRDLLAEEVQDGEVHWLQAADEEFMAIWQANRSGDSVGAVLILHGDGQSADWPHTVSALRNNLSLHGWSALAINLPIEGGDEEIVSARLTAAMSFLNRQGQYNVVVIGHGSGALRAARFIHQLSATRPQRTTRNAAMPRRARGPVRAMVMVAARNSHSNGGDTLQSFLTDPLLPVLDIVYGDHYLDEIEPQKRRQHAKRMALEHFYQTRLMRPTSSGEASENRLTRRIRGFLNRHAKGVEVDRKR